MVPGLYANRFSAYWLEVGPAGAPLRTIPFASSGLQRLEIATGSASRLATRVRALRRGEATMNNSNTVDLQGQSARAGGAHALRLRRGARARTDFPVTVREGSLKASSRCVELSASGAIIVRARGAAAGPNVLTLELYLPERHGAIRVLARRIWSYGAQQAFRFERVSDADRLSLAEHVDLATLRGALVA